tara:strand:+ start:596 stop:781 length:186 start_codon:yes stop_codon:yes gene_type:complete
MIFWKAFALGVLEADIDRPAGDKVHVFLQDDRDTKPVAPEFAITLGMMMVNDRCVERSCSA